MLSKTELESRLVSWAADYGGGRYENLGYRSRNLLQVLIEHGGFVPDSGGFKRPPVRTLSDEVEEAVKEMEAGGMFKPGRVVRCEYFAPDAAMDSRLGMLRQIGLTMSRAGYFQHLAIAKAFLTAALDRRAVA